jgi:molecular chaperone DnaK (HSP70)
MKETQQVTKCSNNKGFSGNSNILPRIKFRVGGQESSPQSLTAATLDRCASYRENHKWKDLS